MAQAVMRAMGSDGGRQMKPHSLARRSPPAVRPGGRGPLCYMTDWDKRLAACAATPVRLSQEQAASPLPRPVVKETSICPAHLSTEVGPLGDC